MKTKIITKIVYRTGGKTVTKILKNKIISVENIKY